MELRQKAQNLNCNLNFLKGVIQGDYIGEYDRGY